MRSFVASGWFGSWASAEGVSGMRTAKNTEQRSAIWARRTAREGSAAREKMALWEGLPDCPNHVDVKTKSPLRRWRKGSVVTPVAASFFRRGRVSDGAEVESNLPARKLE